ncbi:binding--dependent transport system inner membrane component family protein [Burkholderia multivorans]|uniref:Binding--dependent transport system inner membrane component family protein n=1 Tax=Burkholderia multivorans TaxID=87883 RepID=A0ABD7LDP1_9BURK|nr:ABC transporter permease [Burkholderia multivorans]SAK01857.1 binding--dependent transport system inner membrane component family protein [Burkholderia multivorans]SAK03239.1 binding--dependent transport system inner membrane component family protein [Burkholderia multivorans]HEF5154716.1 ABC transporter permease [Burkholderia multivorans]
MHSTESVQRSSALPPSGDPLPPWDGAPLPAAPSPDRPPARRAWRVRLTTGGWVGLSMVGLMLFIAVFAPLLAPHDVGAIVTPDVFAPFSAKLPFGSDFLGRDMLSRILYGTRLTVLLALAAVLLAALTGTTLGLLATVAGRAVDETMSRLLDALTSIPSKMFALMFVAAFGSSLPLLILTAAVSYMPGSYRIARALAVNISTLEFVQVARARGESALYIACVEMLPNMLHPMLADTGLRFTFVVLLLSGLSFLGLGVQPPYADLGSLVRENIASLGDGSAVAIMPAVAIAILTVGVNLLIDGLPHRGRRNGAAGAAGGH